MKGFSENRKPGRRRGGTLSFQGWKVRQQKALLRVCKQVGLKAELGLHQTQMISTVKSGLTWLENCKGFSVLLYLLKQRTVPGTAMHRTTAESFGAEAQLSNLCVFQKPSTLGIDFHVYICPLGFRAIHDIPLDYY